MSQLCGRRMYDIPIRRLPSLHTGLTFIWLADKSSLSRERDEMIDRLCASKYCHIFRYTRLTKCLKYLKQAKLYERIIIILNKDNFSITTIELARLYQYRQIQSMFVVSTVVEHHRNINVDNLYSNTKKISEIFHEFQSLVDRLHELMNEVDQVDDDFFIFSSQPEKAFQNLCDEFGSYVWNQVCRGTFLFSN